MENLYAISTGPETHLDHLAPLCAFWNIPLIVTEKEHLQLGIRFYPMCDIRYMPIGELTLDYIAREINAMIVCGKFFAMQLKPALKLLYNKDLPVIFTPHGYSDKEELLHMPIEQTIRLTYGSSEEGIAMGNLRLEFYLQHKAHFDALVEPFFQTDKKTVLYAPTWRSAATDTSFFESIDQIVDRLADSYNLLVKLHPLLEENQPAHYHRILGKHEKHACFIEKFPAIYPLLEKSDIYLGDFSSVGYDFLYYDRPMYFLKEGGRLATCGEPFLGSLTNTQKELSGRRRERYFEAFGEQKAPRDILEAMKKLLF